MIQQAFSWQDEGKIKKMVNTKWESVKEGSVLLFSMRGKPWELRHHSSYCEACLRSKIKSTSTKPM